MGRTQQTTTQLILDERSALSGFKRALRRSDQLVFDRLFASARKHTAAIGQANHSLPFEAVLLAMLIEQAKEIEELKRAVDE